jgi:exopolysaccharide biosynthesis protein
MALISVTLVTIGATLPASATALPIKMGKHHDIAQLADGVSTWRQSIRIHDTKGWHNVRAVLTRMHTGVAGVRLGANSPGSIVGETRTSIKAQADATRAVGGINADFFSFDADTSVPHGALIINGNVLKTPPSPLWKGNFYVRADGTAAIGALPYTGSLTRKPRQHGDPAKTHSIASVNTLADAELGRITLVTHGLATTPISRKCTVAQIGIVAGRKVVTTISKGHSKLRRLALAHWALLVCGGKAAKWLNTNVLAGDRVNTAITFTDGTPMTAVSGARVLVANGKTFDDAGGFALGPGPNPETFACASKTGTSVLMGVVDGRSAVSFGLTYAQLTRYLKALNCWSGMVFDGGGSSTLVARLPAGTQTTVRNVPSDGRLREVADGLFIYAG